MTNWQTDPQGRILALAILNFETKVLSTSGLIAVRIGLGKPGQDSTKAHFLQVVMPPDAAKQFAEGLFSEIGKIAIAKRPNLL
jgi:hypothetical protein